MYDAETKDLVIFPTERTKTCWQSNAKIFVSVRQLEDLPFLSSFYITLENNAKISRYQF